MHVIACNEKYYIVLQIHYMSLHSGGFADEARLRGSSPAGLNDSEIARRRRLRLGVQVHHDYNTPDRTGHGPPPGPCGLICQCFKSPSKLNHDARRQLTTRSKSLSKMLRIVQNERFTFEIDSENALLNSTWKAEDSRAPSSAFQFSTV